MMFRIAGSRAIPDPKATRIHKTAAEANEMKFNLQDSVDFILNKNNLPALTLFGGQSANCNA